MTGVLGGTYIGTELYVASERGKATPLSRVSRMLEGRGVKRRRVSFNTARTEGLDKKPFPNQDEVCVARMGRLTVFQPTHFLDRRGTF